VDKDIFKRRGNFIYEFEAEKAEKAVKAVKAVEAIEAINLWEGIRVIRGLKKITAEVAEFPLRKANLRKGRKEKRIWSFE
jgi:hypothetical protein